MCFYDVISRCAVRAHCWLYLSSIQESRLHFVWISMIISDCTYSYDQYLNFYQKKILGSWITVILSTLLFKTQITCFLDTWTLLKRETLHFNYIIIISVLVFEIKLVDLSSCYILYISINTTFFLSRVHAKYLNAMFSLWNLLKTQNWVFLTGY